MPYTDHPATNPLDAVRVLVGDTSDDIDLTDNEVAFFLSEEDNNVRRAAARAAESLSAKYAKKADERRVGPLWIRSFSDKSTKYANLAKLLWRRATSGDSVPFAGGISAADKASRAGDTDVVHPAFRRGMMRYRNSPLNENVMPEEILSSPDIQP